MSPGKRRRFVERIRKMDGISLIEFTPALPDLMEAADFVVSMGGYNTVCELACAGARALIVPRTFPRKEQLVRARLLAERGVVRYCEEQEPAPEQLVRHVLGGLEDDPPPRGWGLQFSALDRSAKALEELIGSPARRALRVPAAPEVRCAGKNGSAR
jgi:predicted glycosyltransferase